MSAQKLSRDGWRQVGLGRVSRRRARRFYRAYIRDMQAAARDSKRARGIHDRWSIIAAFERREGRRLDPRDEWSLERAGVAGEVWCFARITAHDEVAF